MVHVEEPFYDISSTARHHHVRSLNMADVMVTPTNLSKWPMMFIIQTLVCLIF